MAGLSDGATSFLDLRAASPAPAGLSSRQDVPQDLPGHIGEAVIPAGVKVGELLVIEAHEVEDGGVQVMDMGLLRGHVESEFVGRTTDRPRL